MPEPPKPVGAPPSFQCPTCGAAQSPSPECRRCRCDLSLVVAETNNEIENPLWHGEMHAIKRFYERADHPDPKDCLFLATHEPCSLCLSGITWSGFDNFYYLFSHQDSADSFAIPYDIQILKAVYAVPDPDRRFSDTRFSEELKRIEFIRKQSALPQPETREVGENHFIRPMPE